MKVMSHIRIALLGALLLATCALGGRQVATAGHNAENPTEWPSYGGSSDGIRYSRLTQINRSNVARLEVAWTYDAGEGPGGTEAQPLVAGGVLYAVTPHHNMVALDAATGKPIWRFESGIAGRGANRGVACWSAGNERRIFAAVRNWVYALDGSTGKPIPGFGVNGRIDLREDLGRDPAKQSIVLTTPGVVYKDLLIVGGRTSESLPAAPGDIRAYDVRTGHRRWSFHTIPHPGGFGYNTWPRYARKVSGSANNWAGMAVDVARGLVFAPTGSAADDFYGANRAGDDLFANTLLALDAKTGRRVWHFQGVRHDLWDRDFPSPPSLVRCKRRDRWVDAVAQTTKSGHLYLFERATGKPLFPIVERQYPASEVPGEVAARTQPLPAKPLPFARQVLTEELLTNRTPAAHQRVLERFRTFRSGGQFVPFRVGQETILFPGFDGGAEYGGSAFDPQTQIFTATRTRWPGLPASRGTKRPGPRGSSTSGIAPTARRHPGRLPAPDAVAAPAGAEVGPARRGEDHPRRRGAHARLPLPLPGGSPGGVRVRPERREQRAPVGRAGRRCAGLSLHRLPQVPGSAGVPGDRAPVGHAQRD
jgi:quinoprotein glucose dehydrogenase